MSISNYNVPNDAARRIAEAWCAPGKKIGAGPWYTCACPGHEDKSQTSLGVAWFEGKDGRGMVKFVCHAGQCDWKDLEERAISEGLLPKWEPTPKHKYDSVKWDVIYQYRDEQGSTLYQKLRRVDPVNGKKDFRQRQPDGNGGWIWHLREVRKVPYNLPEVLSQAKTNGLVLILEGEKDCNTAQADGFVASCNFEGGDKWRDELTGYFRGARCVLIPDNDYVGYCHLNRVGKSFADQGLKLFYLELPGVETKGDYTDWREFCGVDMFQDLLDNDLKEWTGPVENPFEHETPLGKTTQPSNVVVLKPKHAWTENDNVVEIYANMPIVLNLEGLTHSGNALRLKAYADGKIRYSPQRGFFIDDGKKFAFDETGEVFEMAKEVARRMATETDLFPPGDLNKWIVSSLMTSGVSGTLKSVQTLPGIRVHIDDFDSDPFLLNTQDGVLELKTGKVHPHTESRKFLCSQITACGFDADYFAELKSREHLLATGEFTDRTYFNEFLLETIPSWMNVMTWICSTDFELFDYLHELAGYCLTGDTSEQQAYFIHGEGQNLKSTWIDTIANMLGDYSFTVRSEMFMKKHGGHESQQDNFSQLVHIRLAAVQEVNADDKLDEAKVKVFTGKTDKVHARFLHKEPFQYENRAKALFRANHLPTIVSTDKGIWRRVKNIPFYNTVPDDQVMKGFDEELKSEWSKLLALFVFYLQRKLRRGNLVDPKCVVDETNEFREDMDSFGLFLSVVGEPVAGHVFSILDLSKAYEKVASEMRLPTLGIRRFGLELKKRGFKKVGKTRHGAERSVDYKGLRIKDEFLHKQESRYSKQYYNGTAV